MIHLHLIGYTADLDSLVLDLLDEEGRGRYRLVVDGDLFATLDEVRAQRQAAGKDVGVWPPEGYLAVADLERYLGEDIEVPPPAPAPPSTPTAPRGAAPVPEPAPTHEAAVEDDLYAELEDDLEVDAHDDELPAVRLVSRPVSIRSTDDTGETARARLLFDDDDDEDDWDAGTPAIAEPAHPVDDPGGADGEDEPTVVDPPETGGAPAGEASPRDGGSPTAPGGARAAALPDRRVPPAPLPSEPRLSPAEIQARLRAGKSPRAVAKAAGTDVAWIERWLPPILAERHRVLERARGMRLQRSRLGASRDPLGRAVERNLRERDVDLDEVTWDVGRRQDGRWRVSVRFPHRGRSRSATWVLDPERDDLSAASDLARDLGFTRPAARESTPRRRS